MTSKAKVSKKQKIRFDVDGKIPQKSKWGKNNAVLIIKLREAALESRKKAGLRKCFTVPVKIKQVHAKWHKIFNQMF